MSRLLCWMGFHQPVVTLPGIPMWLWDPHEYAAGQNTSASGCCARDGCRKLYQWDN